MNVNYIQKEKKIDQSIKLDLKVPIFYSIVILGQSVVLAEAWRVTEDSDAILQLLWGSSICPTHLTSVPTLA